MITFTVLGDGHLGKQFIHNVPLHRRGDHERIVWAKFEESLDPQGAEVHTNLGDLFDRPVVPYAIVWRAAQLYIDTARRYPQTIFVVLRGNHDASRDLEAISAFDIFAGLVAGHSNIVVVKDSYSIDDLL